MADVRVLNVKISRESFIFLKKTAAEQETSMAKIIERLATNYQKKIEKKLQCENNEV